MHEIATLKNIVFSVMPEAINRASGNGKYPFSARGLYYQVRPLIQGYTQKELSYEYFTPPLLTEYQNTFGSIEGLYYEARGVLIEPHTGREIPLGTREVAAYTPEPWTFNKILYVEKTGLIPILRAGGIAEKYDMAIMSSQGFANRSAKELLAEFEKEFKEMTILCLHDCDISGHEISRTLAEETRTSKHKIKVIDIGLSVSDVKEWKLETEKVSIKYTPPSEFISRLNRAEGLFFIGRKANRRNGVIKGTRCELNAFRPDDLIKFIEAKLSKCGLNSKIIPPPEIIKSTTEERYETSLRDQVRREVTKRMDIENIVNRITKEILKEATTDEKNISIQNLNHQSWRNLIEDEARRIALEAINLNEHIIIKELKHVL